MIASLVDEHGEVRAGLSIKSVDDRVRKCVHSVVGAAAGGIKQAQPIIRSCHVYMGSRGRCVWEEYRQWQSVRIGVVDERHQHVVRAGLGDLKYIGGCMGSCGER